MSRFNRDTYVAVALLVLWSAFFAATFFVEDMGYRTIGSEVWPRLILVALFFLLTGYLFQSLRRGTDGSIRGEGLKAWVLRYRNALWIYVLFFLFLITLPWLGMLLGGILFVFLTLTALGNRAPRDHVVHALVAVGTITAMWALFTFGLNVILPEGVVLRIM